MLYQLSYTRICYHHQRRLFTRPTAGAVVEGWSGRPDSNRRPSAPKADALAKLRYAPIRRETDGPVV